MTIGNRLRAAAYGDKLAPILLVVIALLPARVAAASAPAAPPDASRCLTCHGMTNLAVRDERGAVHSFTVAADRFASSVHGRLTCVQCHEDVGEYPHRFRPRRSTVSCAQDCHARDAAGRPYTHATEVADFDASAHRAQSTGGAVDRPTCLTCHGRGDPHAIARATGASPRERMAQCAGCHDDRERMARRGVAPDAVASYTRSFHYKAIKFGSTQAAVCEDCHTAHRVLPASDARSSVSAAALPSTCGRSACHPGARANFAISGANHLDLRVRREPLLWLEEQLFFVLTAGTMAMLAAGIVLDVQKKFGWIVLLAGAADRVGSASRRLTRAIAVRSRRAVHIARWLLVE